MAGMLNGDFDNIGRNAEWRCRLICANESKYKLFVGCVLVFSINVQIFHLNLNSITVL